MRPGWAIVTATLLVACHHRAAPPALPPPPARVEVVPPDERPTPPRESSGALSAGERDALLQEVQARRAAWRARGITDYTIRVVVECFCPKPRGAPITEVRGGVAVALRDTTGTYVGPAREPWSAYTVEGLFDAVERGARDHDVLDVIYDASLGYPTSIRGDRKIGQVDDWYSIRASGLTPLR